MSSTVAIEEEPKGKIEAIGFADRFVHWAFTGLWINDSRPLRASMSLSGIGHPGTNLMVRSFIPPELLNAGPNDLVK